MSLCLACHARSKLDNSLPSRLPTQSNANLGLSDKDVPVDLGVQLQTGFESLPKKETRSLSDAAPTAGQAAGSMTAAPSISLPKGGGAIRGIGEKFTANPVTGTGSLSVPIAVSPGRSGFGPKQLFHISGCHK